MHGNFRYPAKFFLGLGGVTKQGFDFGGAEVTGIDAYDNIALSGGRCVVAFDVFNAGNCSFVNALAFELQG